MKNIGSKCIRLYDRTWYVLSVFYSKNDRFVLLAAIQSFYFKNKTVFNHCSISFSDIQGERINIVFSSDSTEKDEIHNQIDLYFKTFLESTPSVSGLPTRLLSGDKIWMDYPNNSLVWNAFNLPFPISNSNCSKFAHYTSILIFRLYDDEDTYMNNILSIFGFLMTNICKSNNYANKNDAMVVIKHPIDLISKFENELNTINTYWNINPDEYGIANDFYLWLKEADYIYEQFGTLKAISTMNEIIFFQLNIDFLVKAKLLNILNVWKYIHFGQTNLSVK